MNEDCINDGPDGPRCECARCEAYMAESMADAMATYVPGYQSAVDRANGDPAMLYRILKGRETKADELAGGSS